MSDTNNNIPTRITQLEEATGYEDGMFFAVAKAGRGTYKIPVDEMTPNEQALSDKIENEIVPAVENSFAYGTVDESEIATFTDGSALPMPKLEVAVEPQQDLHGYDSPWVGGAGKNKYNADYFGSTTTYFNRVDTTFTNKSTDSRNDFRFLVQAFNGNTFIGQSNQEVITSAGRYSVTINISSTPTFIRIKHNGSSSDLTFDYPFTQSGQYTISLTVVKTNPSIVGGLEFKDIQLEQGSSVTSYAPYSNICPILGWSAVDVTRTGKNLFDVSTASNGYIDDSGNIVPYANIKASDFIKVIPNEKYTISYYRNKTLPTGMQLAWYDENKNFIRRDGIIEDASIGEKSTSATCPSNGRYLRTSMAYDDISINKNQLELGTTATTYEPYSGNTYSLTFTDGSNPLTVYGGYVDLVSGVLTVEKAYVDLGTLDWQYSSISERFYVGASDLGVKATDASTPFNAISSALIAKTYNEIEAKTVDYAIAINPNATQLFARYSSITSATAFKTAMNGVQLVYELATPLTYQLTPTQVSSLLGVNNIFANTGKILKVEYIRDLDIVINSLLERIAALEG